MSRLSLNEEHLSFAHEKSWTQQPSGSLFFSSTLCLALKKLLECNGVVVLGVVRAEYQGHSVASRPSE